MATAFQFEPRADFVIVRLSERCRETAGGVWLPETSGEATTEGEVIARGPGPEVLSPIRAPLAVGVGEKVLFLSIWTQPVTDEIVAVRERDLIGVLDGAGDLCPLNDWVMLTQEKRPDQSAGGIVLPEKSRAMARWGKILAHGPGPRIANGPFRGTRKPVCCILGLPEDPEVPGMTAYWDERARMVVISRAGTALAVMVRARDLIAVEEKHA